MWSTTILRDRFVRNPFPPHPKTKRRARDAAPAINQTRHGASAYEGISYSARGVCGFFFFFFINFGNSLSNTNNRFVSRRLGTDDGALLNTSCFYLFRFIRPELLWRPRVQNTQSISRMSRKKFLGFETLLTFFFICNIRFWSIIIISCL